MSLAALRTAMVEAAREVPGIGVVNDFEPHATREEEFAKYFIDEELGYVLGWSLMRERTLEDRRGGLSKNWAPHVMVFRGYRALSESGETARDFEDLAEALRTRLRQEGVGLYGGLCILVSPPQVRMAEARMFGALLVHYVEITQECIEEVSSV